MRTNLNTLFSIMDKDKAAILEGVISDLESKIETIQSSLNSQTSLCKWVVLNKAAEQIGMTTPALRHRIKRDQYPEGIVWKQRSRKSTIFINLVELEEYL
ncbi:hypothetical protein H4J50_13585 [Colwellia sp. 6M3]|jgi:hypothetical protein|uniref:hypothetical protein n=1 Tax=Colwellia sp. 6M3 TaxID=2759849 RepID=UPI0015F5BF4B|nr:hypothetical protein [Colwellia sp. 6M3]MBA6417050.1 hypothetical protein [Colwellia sp. 6M3]